MDPLRIGILGAARIAPIAIIAPAQEVGARLVAVAARDRGRAQEFADEHGIERTVADYDALVRDPEIDVVYNPLPNGLHAPWNLAAVRAGKHVLSEKPFAANAAQAREVAQAAVAAQVHVLEAFHYPFHPVFRRLCELIEQGAIGQVRHVEAPMRMPAPAPDDPRWRLELAGGSTMDLGCYAFHVGRHLGVRFAGGEPIIEAAIARERDGLPGVDERLSVEARYPGGATADLGSDMDAGGDMDGDHWDFHLRVTGTTGSIRCANFVQPHLDDTLQIRRDGREVVTENVGALSSYTYQLEAFTALVREGRSVGYDPLADAITQAEFVDAAYRAAGLDPRPHNAETSRFSSELRFEREV